MLVRSARRRQIFSTGSSRKTQFAPRAAGHNSTPKVPLRDAWSRTHWDWRGSIWDPGSNWSVSCWCSTALCWLRTVLLVRCQSRDGGAGSSLLQRILEARGGSRDGETQALEGDAQAASFFCTFASGSPCRWVTQDFLVLLRRRHGRPAGGGGRNRVTRARCQPRRFSSGWHVCSRRITRTDALISFPVPPKKIHIMMDPRHQTRT